MYASDTFYHTPVTYRLGRNCIVSLLPGFVFEICAQTCFFSFRFSTSSVELRPRSKPIKQARAIDLNTIAFHYLCGALLRAIAEKNMRTLP